MLTLCINLSTSFINIINHPELGININISGVSLDIRLQVKVNKKILTKIEIMKIYKQCHRFDSFDQNWEMSDLYNYNNNNNNLYSVPNVFELL